MDKSDKSLSEIDIYRDTPVRLLGYANEVGESFRALVPVRLVYLSYAVAVGYVLADTTDKVIKANKTLVEQGSKPRLKQLAVAGTDALLWQGLASVIVPGFTINRICALSLFLLRSRMALNSAKWTTTALGILCIPFIVHPIDTGVTAVMNVTTRRWMHVDCAPR